MVVLFNWRRVGWFFRDHVTNPVACNFIKRHLGATFEGSRDCFVDVANTVKKTDFTDAECTTFMDKAKAMDKCLPWTNHLTEDAITHSGEYLKTSDWQNARSVINMGKKDNANEWCISLLLEAATYICTRCPSVILEASPWYLY